MAISNTTEKKTDLHHRHQFYFFFPPLGDQKKKTKKNHDDDDDQHCTYLIHDPIFYRALHRGPHQICPWITNLPKPNKMEKKISHRPPEREKGGREGDNERGIHPRKTRFSKSSPRFRVPSQSPEYPFHNPIPNKKKTESVVVDSGLNNRRRIKTYTFADIREQMIAQAFVVDVPLVLSMPSCDRPLHTHEGGRRNETSATKAYLSSESKEW